jgi:hypothetical protein
LGYFRELLNLDADWVVNLDDDAFLLRPAGIVDLVRHLEAHGHAACGMPDGGVTRIRRHNPLACNAFFNVFDLRRVRSVWRDWGRVCAARHRPGHEARVPAWSRRSAYAFDHFERYYGAFFALLDGGETILPLDAEEWRDGVSTLLKDHAGLPLLLHCWYMRHWPTSRHTRQRYRAAIDFARRAQGLDAPAADLDRPRSAATVLPKQEADDLMGRWDEVYRRSPQPLPSGDVQTYRKAAAFLQGLETVEDWGCGRGWLKHYLPSSVRYTGVDGSATSAADVVADLTRYTSSADGVVLRHVLEHNPNWAAILANALRSFRRRLVLVLFTPFVETTGIVGRHAALGVVDLAFARSDLAARFGNVRWTSEEGLATATQYGVEHIFYLEKL